MSEIRQLIMLLLLLLAEILWARRTSVVCRSISAVSYIILHPIFVYQHAADTHVHVCTVGTSLQVTSWKQSVTHG